MAKKSKTAKTKRKSRAARRSPRTVLLLRFAGARGWSLNSTGADLQVIACATSAEARQALRRHRPIAGLLDLGSCIDPAAIAAILRLAEQAPRLRLIALVSGRAARSPELAMLVGRGLLHDYHRLPIDRDRLMFGLGHIAGLVALERAAETAMNATVAPKRASADGLPDLMSARRRLDEALARNALSAHGGNVKRAAKELGVSRVTFYRLMERHGIAPPGQPPLRPVVPRLVPPRPRAQWPAAGRYDRH
ncbi:MAG: VpsR-related response regulator [Dongiaceae bacterium]